MANHTITKVIPSGFIGKQKFYSRPLYTQSVQLILDDGRVVDFIAKCLRKRDMQNEILRYNRAVYHDSTQTISLPMF
jgi:hypothetical protein